MHAANLLFWLFVRRAVDSKLLTVDNGISKIYLMQLCDEYICIIFVFLLVS